VAGASCACGPAKAGHVHRAARAQASHRRQAVPELVLFGLEVAASKVGRRNFERNRFGNGEAVTLQPHEFPRVVGQQPHRLHAEITQDLCTDAIVALVCLETQTLVRLDGVETAVLKFVCADLVRKPDSPPFLIQIQQNAPPLRGDPRKSGLELCTAVAAG